MRLVHISDVHVYDPSSRALTRVKEWSKVAIALAAIGGVFAAGKVRQFAGMRERYPWIFRGIQAMVVAGLSGYLIRRLIDHGHHRAYRSLASQEARRTLFADLESQSFDHLLVTGDVALTPTEAEFQRAAELFDPFWDRLHIVPGNHDVPFIAGSSGDFERTFAERLEPFPIIRDLGEGVVLAGLDTTVRGMLQDPWALLSNARGRITEEQLKALRAKMPAAGTRLLAMHHHLRPNPAGPGSLVQRIYMGPAKGAQWVRRNMRNLGVDLVLHGHQHWNYHGQGYLCAGTSTLQPDGGGEFPTYNIYEFDGGELVEIERREIEGGKVRRQTIPVGDVLPRRR